MVTVTAGVDAGLFSGVVWFMSGDGGPRTLGGGLWIGCCSCFLLSTSTLAM